MKSWLQHDGMEMYSTYNKEKSVAAERFIRTFKNKIKKYMALVLKNMYTDKVANIVNKNNTCHGTIKIKPIKEANQNKFRFEKVIKREGHKLDVAWKGYDDSFNSWIDKKISLYKMSYFPEPYILRKNKIKVELDSSNFATKSDLKNAAGVETSDFAKMADLASLKSYIGKLEKVPSR